MMTLLRFLLFPFAILYDLVTTVRNWFFDKSLFTQKRFPLPIIVVGNLNVGGTGKTPQVEYLIRLLHNSYKIAVLSRGYKRKTKGFVLLDTSHTALDVGDEPLQYFNKFSTIRVAVNGNRVAGVQQLLSVDNLQVILLDDAYQHRKIKGSFYVLLTKYDDLFVDDFLLPTGNLRESRQGAARADVILVTKCPNDLSKDAMESVSSRLIKYKKKIFFTSIIYDDTTSGSLQVLVANLKNYKVLLVTGIANPAPLISFLSENKVKQTHLQFSDHHHFTEKDIEHIKEEFQKINSSNKIILTTEKDYVRLSPKVAHLSFLGMKTAFLNNATLEFNTLIENHIKQAQF